MKRIIILIFLLLYAVGCSKISKKDLVLTKWKTRDNAISCEFISMNTVEINYNGKKYNFFYYIGDSNVIITRYTDYKKYIIQYKDSKIFLNSKALGIDEGSTIEFVLIDDN